MDGWNTSFLLGWPIFRCYVSFKGGTCQGFSPIFFAQKTPPWAIPAARCIAVAAGAIFQPFSVLGMGGTTWGCDEKSTGLVGFQGSLNYPHFEGFPMISLK